MKQDPDDQGCTGK